MTIPLLFDYNKAGIRYANRIKNLFGNSLVAYWQLNESAGTVARDSSPQVNNGTYVGPILFADTNAPTKTRTKAPYINGISGTVNIYSAGLSTDFDPNECTVGIWIKPNSPSLTDGLAHSILRFQADTDNRIVIQKSTANNGFDLWWEASNVLEIVAPTISTYNWHHLAITISKTADQVKIFVDGIQSGVTQTGLQTWVGSLASTTTVIGAASSSATSNVWLGWLVHAILLNRSSSPEEINKVYRWGI